MKYAAVFAGLLVLMNPSFGGSGVATQQRLHVADAATDACFASCANENASCKRVCPTTFNVPCLNACDSRTETCRQACQRK